MNLLFSFSTSPLLDKHIEMYGFKTCTRRAEQWKSNGGDNTLLRYEQKFWKLTEIEDVEKIKLIQFY